MGRSADLWIAHGCSADHDRAGERYAHALTQLSGELWQPGRSFEQVLARICEIASQALGVPRVNAWRYEREHHRLVNLHAYDARATPAHGSSGETIRLAPAYEAALHELRAIDLCEVDHERADLRDDGLGGYFRRHGITALLDAPVCVDGEQMGVLCHEEVGGARDWSDAERAFAGSMGDFVALAYQIARRRRAERELQHLRLHDATTDLPNRNYLLDVLAQRLREGVRAAVVHVQLARGPALPADTASHDALMRRAAQALRAFADDSLLMARVQPDGFAVLAARSARPEDALALARRCLDRLGPVAAAPRTLGVGVACAMPGEDDAERLLAQAEQAACHARESGEGRCEVFDLDHQAALAGRMDMERRLHAAFADGALEVHYQPERDVDSGQWCGAEALLRWRDGEALRAAGEFIDVVEEAGLIVPVGAWVLREACAAAARWPGGTPVRVNVSCRQLDAGTLLGHVREALAASGLAPGRLCLEITETALMRDVEATVDQLQALRALGVVLALDDFGTGYSSLARLKRLPVSVVKVDRAFVAGLPQDCADAAIVAAVVAIARTLGMEVVAEGVETPAQERALAAQGIRRMQGWLHARAMPAGEVARLFG